MFSYEISKQKPLFLYFSVFDIGTANRGICSLKRFMDLWDTFVFQCSRWNVVCFGKDTSSNLNVKGSPSFWTAELFLQAVEMQKMQSFIHATSLSLGLFSDGAQVPVRADQRTEGNHFEPGAEGQREGAPASWDERQCPRPDHNPSRKGDHGSVTRFGEITSLGQCTISD